jgi:hypothetical protein
MIGRVAYEGASREGGSVPEKMEKAMRDMGKVGRVVKESFMRGSIWFIGKWLMMASNIEQ